MNVRGWLLVGDSSTGNDLPSQMYVGDYLGPLPKAANFHVGQWLYWRVAPAGFAGPMQLSLVCVDIPL